MSQLQQKALKNPKFIAELVDLEEETERGRVKIRDVVEQMNKEDVFIDSIASLKEKLEQEHSIVAKPT